jgi:PRTRC genetic system ThiF family protein
MNRFDPHLNLRSVVLVGLGGTGSQWARSLCRIVYDLKRRNKHFPQLTFVDPDRVEANNVGRQMFTTADVGQFKAEVLAKRFSYSLGLDIQWFNQPFHANTHSAWDSIICGAVDNHQARQAIHKANKLWIDAGNHRQAGQVTIGNTDDLGMVERNTKDREWPYLPNAGLLFPDLLKPESAPAIDPAASCAELVERGEQHLLINDLIASIAAQYTYKLLNQEPIHSFLTYVDGDSLAMRSIPITKDDLDVYLRRDKAA